MTLYRQPRPTPRSRPRRRGGLSPLAWLFIASVAICVVVAVVLGVRSTEHTVVATVDTKERVCDSGQNGKCRYLLFTDNGTFEVTDTLIYIRFNSSDVYGKIHEKTRYRLRVAGFRSGIASSYENVLEATEEP